MNQRLHIAQFTNTYFPVVSGVVRSVSTFRQALSQLGHNVFVFAQHSHDYEDTEPFIFRYPALDLPLMSGFPLTIPISPFNDKLLPLLGLDVIHSHHPFLLGQTAANKASELDLPLVFTYHTRYQEYSHYVSLNQEFVKEAISRWLGEYMHLCHHIVVPSESIKTILSEEYGVTKQVTAIPTGIDLKPYQQADGQAVRKAQGWADDTVLISVGRLAKEKNWHMLLEAVAQAIGKREHTRLVIIGDGEERQALEDHATDLNIADKVEFTGIIPFADMPGYLKAADLFCFASLTETQGLVTMEAMAAGLPVVAIDASGTRDVVEDGAQGFLTLNDPEALARAIEHMVRDKALRERCRASAWEKAQTFEMKRQAEKLVELYHQAMADKKAGRLVSPDKQKEVFHRIDEIQWSRFFASKS